MRTDFQTGRVKVLLLGLGLLSVAGCGGGGGSSNLNGTDQTTVSCDGSCATSTSTLSVSDVQRVIARAVHEAQAQGVDATIAVVDRVGNVLAVYQMARQEVLVATSTDMDGNPTKQTGLEGIRLDVDGVDAAAAISKAITGAYLSSEGNAFTTRTANQIVQENFNPGEVNQPSGPLFGVQFSQLPCSDFSLRFEGLGSTAGPKRSPLGLSADPGGLPLYKGGTVVGGVGVLSDGRYSIDPDISDLDRDTDELIALAGSFGFSAPPSRRADRITVDGKILRFADAGFADLASDPLAAPSFSALPPGNLIPVAGYSDGSIDAGVAFGTPESGVRPDVEGLFPGRDAFVFVDNADAPRFAPQSATDSGQLGVVSLSDEEVRVLLDESIALANRMRAQIRTPAGSQARVTIAIVDTLGEVLGMVRTRDAPVFGADVSLQKARTAVLFSSSSAAEFLRALPPALYLSAERLEPLGSYVDAVQQFLGRESALEDGAVAFSDRAGGNLSRPFFPDGIRTLPHGPLSRPIDEWSPFSTGLQLDLSLNAILQHVLFLIGAAPDVAQICSGVALDTTLALLPSVPTGRRAANGIQIFPGSVPIYRGSTLVGGIGVSGDGVDQDDMIAFLGVHNAGERLNGAVNNAPVEMRADQLEPSGERLRYVQCPQAPFIDSNEQMPCSGK